MSKSYYIRLDNGAMVTFGSPQAIKESLEVHWPAGRYEIHEGHATGSPLGWAGRRWGTAIKRADGAVTMAAEVEPDR
jgi:hypothetical protein